MAPRRRRASTHVVILVAEPARRCSHEVDRAGATVRVLGPTWRGDHASAPPPRPRADSTRRSARSVVGVASAGRRSRATGPAVRDRSEMLDGVGVPASGPLGLRGEPFGGEAGERVMSQAAPPSGSSSDIASAPPAR